MTLRSRLKRLGLFLILVAFTISTVVSYTTTIPWALSVPVGLGAAASIMILIFYVIQVIRAYVSGRAS